MYPAMIASSAAAPSGASLVWFDFAPVGLVLAGLVIIASLALCLSSVRRGRAREVARQATARDVTGRLPVTDASCSAA